MIKSITIKNFRSIVDETIEFSNFTCLVGNNDCGKSNVLKALNLFFNNQTDFNTEFNFDRDYSKLAKTLKKKAKQITISITFNIPKNYKDGGEKTWTKSWRETGLHSDNIDDIVSSKSKTKDLLYKIQYQYVPAIKSTEYFKDLMSKMYGSMMESVNNNLSDENQRYSQSLQEITKNLTQTLSNTLGINSIIQMPENMGILFRNLEFSTSDGLINEINLNCRGDGIKSRHIPSILKYIDENIQSNNAKGTSPYNFIWGYEEPENSVEFISCSQMADELYNISQKKQILVTTHSPFFYSKGKENGATLYYVRKSEHGISCYDKHSSYNIDKQMGLMPLVAPYIEEQSKELDKLKRMNEDLNNKLSNLTDRIIIITEGKTDVKHIETAFNSLKDLDQNILNRIKYYEFSENQTLGYAELGRLLNHITKCTNNNTIIGIFDRDIDNNILSQQETFKCLGNNVFACLIPPLENEERKKDDKICIEHYYTNDEITKILDNGRRLYLGNEFNKFGKSNDSKFTTKKGGSGSNSSQSDIAIFESCDLRPIDDMALVATKNEFAEYVKNNTTEFNFENFRKIFDLIAEIVENANNSSNNT